MPNQDTLTRAIIHSLVNKKGDNVADALFAIAKAIESLAIQVKYLGNGDAATPMGAIEAFGKHLGEKMDSLTDAISREE